MSGQAKNRLAAYFSDYSGLTRFHCYPMDHRSPQSVYGAQRDVPAACGRAQILRCGYRLGSAHCIAKNETLICAFGAWGGARVHAVSKAGSLHEDTNCMTQQLIQYRVRHYGFYGGG